MASRLAGTVLPKNRIPSRNDVLSAGFWGGTAALGGLWLVQPWGWIKAVALGDETEEDAKDSSDEGPGKIKPPAAETGEDVKRKQDDDDNDDDEEGSEEGGDNQEKDSKKEESKDEESTEDDSKSEQKEDDSQDKGK